MIWDLASGATLYILKGHTLGISDIAWSVDSKMLATASDDMNGIVFSIYINIYSLTDCV
jgi:COMPASS component SWD3